MVRNGNHIAGELSEIKVTEDLLNHSCRVSFPHGESHPYDLVGDYDGELLKIQVKKANHEDRRKYRIYTDGYDEGDVDLFAGYVKEEDAVFYVPFNSAGQSFAVTFTPRESMNETNAERAYLAKDYLFEQIISTTD